MSKNEILAKVFFHDIPEENDYDVHDEKHIVGECDGCVPAYIVTRGYLDLLIKDKARLDWLADVNNNIGNVLLPTDIVERNLGSLRDGIDEAMKINEREQK